MRGGRSDRRRTPKVPQQTPVGGKWNDGGRRNRHNNGRKEAELRPKAAKVPQNFQTPPTFHNSGTPPPPPEVLSHSGLRGLFLEAVLSEGGGRGGDGASDKLIISLSKWSVG